MSKPKRGALGGLEGLRRILAREEQARADAAAQEPSGGSAPNRRSKPGAKPGKAGGPPSKARATTASVSDAAEIPLVDADDHVLFQRAVKGVTPLGGARRALLPPVPSASARELRLRREAAAGRAAPAPAAVSDHYVLAAAASDASSFLRAGCGPDLLKGLRRGKWPVGATLDLHGSTLDEARQRLDQFLQSCLTHQVRCVCVIHGKGHGSRRGESVLKTTVRRWLGQLECVQAYVECREEEGGSGAVQVLLRMSESA